MAWIHRAKLPLTVLVLAAAAVGACMLPQPSPSLATDGESFDAWVRSQSLSGAGAGQSITRLPNAAPIGAAGPVRRVHIVAGPNGQPLATYPTTAPRNAIELGVYDLRRNEDGTLEYIRPLSETTRYRYTEVTAVSSDGSSDGTQTQTLRRAVEIELGKVEQQVWDEATQSWIPKEQEQQ